MLCNLVKTKNVVKKKDKKTGQEIEVVMTNFKLVFEGGAVIPVELKEYFTNDKNDTKKVEQLTRINHDNYVRMDSLATLEKDD